MLGTCSYSVKNKGPNPKYGFAFSYLPGLGFIRFGIPLQKLVEKMQDHLPEEKITIFKRFKYYKQLLEKGKYENCVFLKGTLKLSNFKDKSWKKNMGTGPEWRMELKK